MGLGLGSGKFLVAGVRGGGGAIKYFTRTLSLGRGRGR